ncbi:unnamed protein product, partial [Hapterophycus canaliculatus]
MRVVDLRAELKTRGLPVSGLKTVLIQRLQEHDNSLAGRVTPAGEDREAEGEKATAITTTAGDDNSTDVKVSIEAGAAASAAGGSETVEASTPSGKKGKAAVASPITAAKEEPTQEPSSPLVPGAEASASATAADTPAAGTTSPVLKSTRSKTRRASMASFAAAATPAKAEAAEAEVKPEVSVKSEEATVAAPSSAEAVGGGGAGGGEEAEPAAEALDENSAMQIRLAKGSGLVGVLISAACIGVGHGLSAGNLVTLHVALLGLFIAGTASNRRPTGSTAFAARALVTLAVALVASEALLQRQVPLRALPADGEGEESGMAALAAFVSTKVAGSLSCSGPPGG